MERDAQDLGRRSRPRQQLDVDHRDVPAPHHDGAARVGGLLGLCRAQRHRMHGLWLCASQASAATALRTQIEGEAKWFSSATIAFHVLFAVFLVKSLLGEDGLSVPQSEAPVAAGAFLGAAFLLSLLPKSVFPWLGALVWVGSITLFGLRGQHPHHFSGPVRFECVVVVAAVHRRPVDLPVSRPHLP